MAASHPHLALNSSTSSSPSLQLITFLLNMHLTHMYDSSPRSLAVCYRKLCVPAATHWHWGKNLDDSKGLWVLGSPKSWMKGPPFGTTQCSNQWLIGCCHHHWEQSRVQRLVQVEQLDCWGWDSNCQPFHHRFPPSSVNWATSTRGCRRGRTEQLSGRVLLVWRASPELMHCRL